MSTTNKSQVDTRNAVGRSHLGSSPWGATKMIVEHNMKLTLIARVRDRLILATLIEGKNDQTGQSDMLDHFKEARTLVEQLNGSPAQQSVESGPFVYHYAIIQNICALVLCNRTFPRNTAFQYLNDIGQEFLNSYSAMVEQVVRPCHFADFDKHILQAKQRYEDKNKFTMNVVMNELQGNTSGPTTSGRFRVDREAGGSQLQSRLQPNLQRLASNRSPNFSNISTNAPNRSTQPILRQSFPPPIPNSSSSCSSNSPSLASNNSTPNVSNSTTPNVSISPNASTTDTWWNLDAREERFYVGTDEFNRYLQEQRSKNVFSKGVVDVAAKAHHGLPQYSLESALRFSAATNYWATARRQDWNLPSASKYSNLKTQGNHPGIHAFYKVIAFVQEFNMKPSPNDKYILSACHFFVYGDHRGDLVYLEADCTTIIRDFDYNCLNQLYIGDVVMVSALSLGQGIKSNAFPKTIPEKCVWKVARMTILTRDIKPNIPYYYLKSIEKAAIAGSHKPHTVVTEKKWRVEGAIRRGTIFNPNTYNDTFNWTTEDYLSLEEKTRFTEGLPRPVETTTPIIVHTGIDRKLSTDLSEPYMMIQKYGDVIAAEKVEILTFLVDSAIQVMNSKQYDTTQFTLGNVSMDGMMMHGCIKNTNVHFQASAKGWPRGIRVRICGSGWTANGTIETSEQEGFSIFISVLLENELRHAINGEPITIEQIPSHI